LPDLQVYIVLKTSQLWSKTTKKVFAQAFEENPQIKHSTTEQSNEQFKLLIINQFFPPDFAATGQLIQELSNQLDQQNIQVSVFTGQPGYAYRQKQAPAEEINHNVKIQRAKFKQFYSKRIRSKTLNGIIFTLMATRYLCKNARKYDAVILTTAPPFLAIAGYLANVIYKLDYICLIYDLYPDVVLKLGVISEDNLIIKLWHRLNAAIWNRSKKIVVLSNTMKAKVVEQYPAIAPKIEIIHNWADPTWIKPMPKADNWFAKQHQIEDKFTVLYSGNLGHCHDLETILNTAQLLRSQPIQFMFIGAGVKYEQCQQAATELKLDNCVFLPYQDRANLPYSLTAGDLALVSIAPGLEGVIAPSKVYGIMAAGTAIAAICEPHSYLRQLITDADCGKAFDNHHSEQLAEFILTLAGDPELASKMGDAGRNYLQQHFTPQLIAQQYCGVLGVEVDSLDPSPHQEHIVYGMVNS
jgi:glycosyltransferase involved in cell wall biosynthesis